jgi:undecaprenyl-diphosphatase
VLTLGLWLLARPDADLRWKLACASALTSAGVALAANQVIARLWERPRPFAAHPLDTHLLATPSPDPSFPSDHAAAAFAIAVAVLTFSRPVGAWLLAVATAIALLRIAVGLHYPSDVVAGALVGAGSALLVTHAGRPWVVRAVVLASRLTDPVVLRARHAGRRWRRS